MEIKIKEGRKEYHKLVFKGLESKSSYTQETLIYALRLAKYLENKGLENVSKITTDQLKQAEKNAGADSLSGSQCSNAENYLIENWFYGDLLVNVLDENKKERAPKTIKLSKREQQVISHLAEGHKIQAVANILNISNKTVSTFVRRIRKKVGVSNKKNLYYLMNKLENEGIL